MFSNSVQLKRQHIATDIVFVVDSSSNVSKEEYRYQKEFVKNVANLLGVKPGHSRAGFITYGSRSFVSFGLGSYTDQNNFRKKIDDAPHIGGEKQIDKALVNSVRVFQNVKRLAPKILLLFTTGSQIQQPDEAVMGNVLRSINNLQIKTYVINIGTNKRPSHLIPLFDNTRNIFTVQTFNNLRPRQQSIVTDIIKDVGKLFFLILL